MPTFVHGLEATEVDLTASDSALFRCREAKLQAGLGIWVVVWGDALWGNGKRHGGRGFQQFFFWQTSMNVRFITQHWRPYGL